MPATMRKWRSLGLGPVYVKVNDTPFAPIRYRLSDLAAYLARREVTPPRDPKSRHVVNHLNRPPRKLAFPENKIDSTVGEDRVKKALWKACQEAKSTLTWSREHHLNPADVSMMLTGQRTVSPRVAAHVGFNYRVVIHYEKQHKPK